jgi:hypothetical protein
MFIMEILFRGLCILHTRHIYLFLGIYNVIMHQKITSEYIYEWKYFIIVYYGKHYKLLIFTDAK